MTILWPEHCEVTIEGIAIVLGVVSILWLSGRLYLGLAVLYFFGMFWLYTLNQNSLTALFGPHALGWYGVLATLLLGVITIIFDLFPDHH